MNDMKSLRFKHYKVVQKSDKYFGVYDNNNKLITYADKWKRATKIASMLDKAYSDGYSQGYYDGGEW